MSIEKLPNVIEWREPPFAPNETGTFLICQSGKLGIEVSAVFFDGEFFMLDRRWRYPTDIRIDAWADMPTRATEDLLRQAYRRGYADGTAACDDDGIGTWPEPEQVESALGNLKVDA